MYFYRGRANSTSINYFAIKANKFNGWAFLGSVSNENFIVFQMLLFDWLENKEFNLCEKLKFRYFEFNFIAYSHFTKLVSDTIFPSLIINFLSK